jgi:hypothetical protein
MTQDLSKKQAGNASLVNNRHHLPVAFISCLFLLVMACSKSQQDIPTLEDTRIVGNNAISSSTVQPLINLSPTHTPNITPTITQEKSTLTPSPIIDLIHQDANPTSYRLVTPDAELLIQQINGAYGQLLNARQVAMSNQPLEEGLSEDAEAGLEATLFEVEYHFQDGFPSPQQAFNIPLNPYLFGSDDYALVIPYYQAGFFDILRNHQLSDHLSLQQGDIHFLVYQAELDGDSDKEWLAFADANQLGLFTWLKINSSPEGALQLMPSDDDGFIHHISHELSRNQSSAGFYW